MAGGEGPWHDNVRPVSPGVLAAGFNPATTDAVGMSIMGFDPMADGGSPPFELCDNFPSFAQLLGIGTRDLSRIEILGTSIRDARYDFRTAGLSPPPDRRPSRR
jgi:hypothetical protein